MNLETMNPKDFEEVGWPAFWFPGFQIALL
jgi:hypothetical protein